MEVSVQKPKKNSLEYRLEVICSSKDLDKKIKQKLNNLSKTVKMAGFRPGKVPISVVQSKYEEDVKWEIVQDEIQEAYRQALVQEEITPAGMGVFEQLNYDNLEKISFTAVVEKLPEVELTNLEKLKINRYIPLIKDEDIEAQLKKYQNYARTWEPKIVGSEAVEGDQVIIDFEGKLEDGSTFDGNQATDFPVTLGEKQMLPEFEKALYGTAEGVQKTVSFTFPKGYGEQTLSEKKAIFTITVKNINAAKVPALDDAEFLKKMGIEEGGVEQLKDFAKSECSIQLEQTLNNYNHRVLQDALLQSHKFIVPQTHIEEEKNILKSEIQQQSAQQDPNNAKEAPPLSKEQEEQVEKQAYERCKLALIYRAITKEKEVKLDTKAIDMQLANLCQQYFKGDIEAFKKSPQLPQVKKELESRNMMEQVHNAIYEKAKITEIQKHNDDLEKLSKTVFPQ
jgi:trigger factor